MTKNQRYWNEPGQREVASIKAAAAARKRQCPECKRKNAMGKTLITRDRDTGVRTYERKCRWCGYTERRQSAARLTAQQQERGDGAGLDK